MTSLLFGGRYAPVTSAFGLLSCPLEQVLDPFTQVVADRLELPPAAVRRRSVPGPLEAALRALGPPREGPTGDRFLLVTTDGGWVAYFENAAGGGDPRIAAALLPDRLGCWAVLVYAAPDPEYAEPTPGGLSIVGFSLRAPGRAGMLDSVRTLVAAYGLEAGLQQHGDPLPVEAGDEAAGPLDLERLDRYLRSLDIRAFDPDFFLPAGTEAVLLEAGFDPASG